ncbi:ER membrane complex subunit 2 [Nowakowskiella sp. JEL0078]|nr:ER membrane complex subunit 2 [Nowakowskiella sp. JEL0078]
MNDISAKLRRLRLGPEVPGNNVETYNPSEVLFLGLRLLKDSTLSKLEKFDLTEQLFMASLDTGNLNLAKEFLSTITESFPVKSSARSARLQGLYYEATGDYESALEIYKEADDTIVALKKRLVPVFILLGRRQEAIEFLVKYLDTFMSDVEAWSELESLYFGENSYQQAAFCVEELMLLRPQNHLYHIRYADIMYTINQFELAVKHYARALELCTDNLRALYGLRLSIDALPKGDTADPKADVRNSLHKITKERLISYYEGLGKDGSELTSIVKTWLHTV